MTTIIPLHESLAGAAEREILAGEGLRASLFRFRTGIAALRLANTRGEVVVLPWMGGMVWSANFDGVDLAMASGFALSMVAGTAQAAMAMFRNSASRNSEKSRAMALPPSRPSSRPRTGWGSPRLSSHRLQSTGASRYCETEAASWTCRATNRRVPRSRHSPTGSRMCTPQVIAKPLSQRDRCLIQGTRRQQASSCVTVSSICVR